MYNPNELWIIKEYFRTLKSVYYWAKRLDKSTLDDEDKGFLIHAYMIDLFTKSFYLTRNIWLSSIISINDTLFWELNKMEYEIKNIFDKYPMKVKEE
jgi:hypothetical protein